jgi:hypothetical protein
MLLDRGVIQFRHPLIIHNGYGLVIRKGVGKLPMTDQGKIAQRRVKSETHLYFGTNPECRLTADDYMDVMASIGITPAVARDLYPTLMDVSRKLSRARNEERSVLVNGTLA